MKARTVRNLGMIASILCVFLFSEISRLVGGWTSGMTRIFIELALVTVWIIGAINILVVGFVALSLIIATMLYQKERLKSE